MTMEVYRIENKELRGPWCHTNNTLGIYIYDEDKMVGIDPSDHPCADTDGAALKAWYLKKESMPQSRFGVISIYSVLQWFPCPHGRRAMDYYGYVLNIYRVAKKHVIEGNSQLVFNCEKATLIKTIRLTDI